MFGIIKSILTVIGIALAAIAGVTVALLGYLGLILLGLIPWMIQLGILLAVLFVGLKIFGVI